MHTFTLPEIVRTRFLRLCYATYYTNPLFVFCTRFNGQTIIWLNVVRRQTYGRALFLGMPSRPSLFLGMLSRPSSIEEKATPPMCSEGRRRSSRQKHAVEATHTLSEFTVHRPNLAPRFGTPTFCKLVQRGLALEYAWRLCREHCGSSLLASRSGRREESSGKRNAYLIGTSWPKTAVGE